MSRPERQQNVLDLLKGLRGIEPLKQLFWSELNYQRVNQPLSRRGWTESAGKALADDPVLFAGGGEDNAFHVIYCQLASNALARGFERPVVTQLLREHPYALFVFSNKGQTDWHFLNVKFDDQTERRRLFRRITVRPGAGLRTATERVQLLDLAEIHPELFGITPLAIQQRCDAAFDVEAVTKDFFREVANWYFWALKHASFPKDAPKENDGHDHISIIRLITRLIFCWFVKEKGLIPGELFDQTHLARMLAGFAPDKSGDSVFYKAILQNLFFATLNTEMDKRGWRREDQNFMAHSLYRHRELFQKTADALDIFKNIPFLNGGLFECLDKDLGENAKPRYLRIDGFSDRADSQPTVPDFLFFGGEREVDLSAEYDDKKFKRVPVRGLIHTFNRYNFTVEEDTPIDQEVALDPELSGKVFENLLAAYNPETGATARKQTGSFYTPREIVNYMVDESLIACLQSKLVAAEVTRLTSSESKTGGQKEKSESSYVGCYEAKLRHLFAYNDEPHHQFTPQEVDALIVAIDGLKSLDPAVGSGAFPMGILHKLVFILGKLDPRNEKWKERQIARVRDTMTTAEKIEDATARERAVRELEQQITGINEAFEHNELDYGRKLYLIENCIYGVDIQPIAVQIAKMRFFISLVVDQKIDDGQPNRGVRPLPNLETKFVAANTLIGVNRPGQQLLRNREIEVKEAELRRVRQRHFDAKTPKQKAKCRDEDARLRAEIAELLKGDGWDTATARKLASWDPYDQNVSADFFDAEWMFGLTDGFNVCIGNPPFVSYYSRESASNPEIDRQLLQLRKFFAFTQYDNKTGRLNLWMFFAEKFMTLACDKGVAAFLADVNFTKDVSRNIRRYLTEHTNITQFVHDLSEFENVASGQVIVFAQRGSPTSRNVFVVKSSIYQSGAFQNQEELVPPDYNFLIERNDSIVAKLSKLKNIGQIDCLNLVTGVQVGGTELYKGKMVKDYFYRDNWDCKKVFPSVTVRSVTKYSHPAFERGILFDYDLASEITKSTERSAIVLQKYSKFLRSEKIFIRQSAFELTATLGEANSCGEYSLFSLISESNAFHLFYLLGLLNSKLLNYFAIKTAVILCKKGTQPQIRKAGLERLPIVTIPLSQQNKIIDKVEKIISAKKRNPSAETSTLEHQIDEQVYALYGLTPEEIKIVEVAS
jgi:type I restriction-modification system DNA methylase subunit